MKVIIPKVEIWEQPNHILGLWKHIARCTRVCYQSERKKNPDETDEAFVKRVILRAKPAHSEANHLEMLEHGTVYLTIPCTTEQNAMYINAFVHNKYSRWRRVENDKEDGYIYHITTNLRVLIENGLLKALQYICIPNEYHYRRVTVCFITNIGVSRELNRHDVNSKAEESTRYCNYSKDSENSGLNIVCPTWLENVGDVLSTVPISGFTTDITVGTFETRWDAWDYYWFALKSCEFAYNNLIRLGWKPQQAREVLPLATKTQLVHTAFVDDWEHLFRLRGEGISGAPHPNVKPLILDLMKQFKEHGYTKN